MTLRITEPPTGRVIARIDSRKSESLGETAKSQNRLKIGDTHSIESTAVPQPAPNGGYSRFCPVGVPDYPDHEAFYSEIWTNSAALIRRRSVAHAPAAREDGDARDQQPEGRRHWHRTCLHIVVTTQSIEGHLVWIRSRERQIRGIAVVRDSCASVQPVYLRPSSASDTGA